VVTGTPRRSAGLDAPPEPADGYFARRVRTWQAGSFVKFAGSTRSRSARAVLLLAASQGEHGEDVLDDLLSNTSADHHAGQVALVREMDKTLLLALATLIGNQQLDADDTQRALRLFGLVEEAHGPLAFTRVDRLHYLELLAEVVDRSRFCEAFSRNALVTRDWAQGVLLSANLHNHFIEGRDGDDAHWHRLVNSIFVAGGVEPLEVAPGTGAAMDRILCASGDMVVDGPRVTVLVPTHNPGPRLGTAMSSLVSQTWRNCEFLILDDGSDRTHQYAMRAWEARDDRVRVIHMPGNVGNYAARNIGIREATGEFLTVHDDDDWSHPRKIEMQARNLLANPDQLVNMSQLIRATDDLEFCRINSNLTWIQPNYSSLMYRREETVDLIGYWDEVNRSGDAEYRNRLVAATGRVPTVVGGAPMSFLRVRRGSLTAGEIQRAYLDPRRRWYDMASRGWHAETVAAGHTPKLEAGSSSPRSFAAPTAMVGARTREALSVDIVYATDFRFPGGNTSVSVNEIESLLARGLRVALLQMDSPVLGATGDLHARALQVAMHENCFVVSNKDRVDGDLLIVRHPTVLQFAEPERSLIRSRAKVLIVNHAPALRDGTEAHYEINTCVANYVAIFGGTPLVAPESGVIRDCLQPLLRTPMTDFDWPGSIPEVHAARREVDLSRAPVIGRHSRDNREKWPQAPDSIGHVYPVDGSRDVRVLGGAGIAIGRLGYVPSWTIYPFGSVNPRDFLREIDFWVYFHDENLVESFGMATVEAMSSGVVVVLPSYMESTFGEGALYAEADEVQDLVDAVWSDPERYQAQSRRGIEVAGQRFSVASFYERIDRLTTDAHIARA
jgi:hypothetical protein